MATKSSLATLFATGSLLLALTGCQTPSEVAGSRADQQGLGPTTSGGSPKSANVEPSPVPPTKEAPKKVAVILGPGGAKALAHVGVLKALQQQRVPIEKVIGLEWGALIAGLFANKGQVHDLEWKLYKMEQENLPRAKGFFVRHADPTVKVLADYLNESFNNDEVAHAKVAFECPSRSLWTGLVTWQNKGPLKDAVKRCLPYPPVFKVEGNIIAGATQAAESVERLAKEGYNVIILVNVLGSAMPVAQDSLLENVNYVILWQEVKRAMAEATRMNVETITVDTSGIPVLNFDAKKDLLQAGEAAGQKAAASLISKYGF